VRLLICILMLLGAAPALAHKPSDSYLRLSPTADGFAGDWRIALRDLDAAVGVDIDVDGRIDWGELRRRHAAIAEYALARLRIVQGADERCTLSVGAQLVENLSDGAYAVLPLSIRCPYSAAQWTLDYGLLFDIDPTHRGLVTLNDRSGPRTFVLSPERRQATLSPTASRSSQFMHMLLEGVRHIWSGFDHLLFLAALLLPAGLRSARDATRFRPLMKEVLWLVTAFTVAHSVTLSLAALRLVTLPPRLVETVIAVSIIVAGLRLRRAHPGPAVWIAFGFGLIHGFGFANVLADMQLPTGALAASLFAFNVGVELGQCAVVAAVLPFIWYARRFAAYRRVLLPAAAVLIVSVGALWTIERGVGMNFLALAAL
jgi:HupE / UreJ protein